MKSPFIYQPMEESCGGISVFNSLLFLFDREEIPKEFLRIMSVYSVSCYDQVGQVVNNDFSKNLMFFASSWINDYAKAKHIPLKTKYITGDDVNLLEIRKCLLAGGCVDLKVYREGNHYINITNMDDNFMYIFDSYYRSENYYKQNNKIQVVLDKPFYYNRKVKIEHFISSNKSELVLGPVPQREAILFFRDDSMMQREFD